LHSLPAGANNCDKFRGGFGGSAGAPPTHPIKRRAPFSSPGGARRRRAPRARR
jgi:hypothetical protein